MSPAARRSIVFFCIALILFAVLIPSVGLQPVVLVALGFAFVALASFQFDRIFVERKPQGLEYALIRSPRPPPVR